MVLGVCSIYLCSQMPNCRIDRPNMIVRFCYCMGHLDRCRKSVRALVYRAPPENIKSCEKHITLALGFASDVQRSNCFFFHLQSKYTTADLNDQSSHKIIDFMSKSESKLRTNNKRNKTGTHVLANKEPVSMPPEVQNELELSSIKL